MKRLALKVCGLKDPVNIAAIASLKPDYLGFVFARNSPRSVAAGSLVGSGGELPRVGVFVDAPLQEICDTALRNELSVIQLHGSESQGFAKELRQKISPDTAIWRAISISRTFPEAQLSECLEFCSAFVFDAAGVHAGGNGQLFDWELIPRWVCEEVPFFLSGGIGPENIMAAAEFAQAAPAMLGVDVNSKVECGVAGVKDEKLVQLVMERMKSYVA